MSVAAEPVSDPGRPFPRASAPALGTGPQPRFRFATSPFSGESETGASSRALLGSRHAGRTSLASPRAARAPQPTRFWFQRVLFPAALRFKFWLGLKSFSPFPFLLLITPISSPLNYLPCSLTPSQICGLFLLLLLLHTYLCKHLNNKCKWLISM